MKKFQNTFVRYQLLVNYKFEVNNRKPDTNLVVAANDEDFHSASSDELQCQKAEYEFLVDEINQAIRISNEKIQDCANLYQQALSNSNLETVVDSQLSAYINYCYAIEHAITSALLLKENISLLTD
jgi:beta-N-acetylglucosaminidase